MSLPGLLEEGGREVGCSERRLTCWGKGRRDGYFHT
jgi:hypothetical protein